MSNYSTKLRAGSRHGFSVTHEAMRFFSADPMPERIRAAYKLALNEYNGATTLQLIIEYWEKM